MAKKVKMGRPSIYDTRIKPYMRYIAQMREDGKTHQEIADFLGIALRTYHKYKAEVEEFMHTSKKSDDILVDKLEAGLYDMALGRVTVENRSYTTYDKETNSHIDIETYTGREVKQLPPVASAMFFALNNLRPDKWKHRNEVTSNSNTEVVESINKLAMALTDNETE